MRFFPMSGFVATILSLGACATTPQARIDKDPASFAALSPEQQLRVQQGSVGVGFDEAATKLALGEPDRVIERESADGNTQVWIYYVIVPSLYNDGYCASAFPYYSYRVYCRSTLPTQYEERTRVIFKDGKVLSVERAR